MDIETIPGLENSDSIIHHDKSNEINIKNENINIDDLAIITEIDIESKTPKHETIIVSTRPVTESTVNKTWANGANKRAETKRKTIQNLIDANIRFERQQKNFSLGLGFDGEELSISSLSRIASMAAVFIHATGEIFFYLDFVYCIVLYCTVLYCIVLYCIVLYCIVLYCIVLYCIVLNCIALN